MPAIFEAEAALGNALRLAQFARLAFLPGGQGVARKGYPKLPKSIPIDQVSVSWGATPMASDEFFRARFDQMIGLRAPLWVGTPSICAWVVGQKIAAGVEKGKKRGNPEYGCVMTSVATDV